MNVVQSFEFNTGRHYAANGQIIRVLVISDREDGDWPTVWFSDRTRNIDGKFDYWARATDPEFVIRRALMDRYDEGKYEYLSQFKFDDLWKEVHK